MRSAWRRASLVLAGVVVAHLALLRLGAQAPAPPAAAPQASARVFLFATGGTISNRAGGRLTVDELIKSVPGLDRIARVEGEQFANVASTQVTMAQWLDLARRVNERFRSDAGLGGVVVTSGTDTLEELAYFLHLSVRDDRPVVVVGSMRNPSQTGYEGVANLEDAVRVAADASSRGLGTVVVLNDEIHSARDVTKTNSRSLDTFTSRDYGILGTVFDRVAYFRRPIRRHSARSEFDVAAMPALPRVDVLLAYQDAPGDLIRAAVDAGARGLVIAGAGAGGVSGTQGDGLRYAAEKKVFVVTTTRAGAGGVGTFGGGRAGGTPTYRIGGDDLQPVKARVLLMLAIASTADGAVIQRMFAEY
jgi:L-asparaginase